MRSRGAEGRGRLRLRESAIPQGSPETVMSIYEVMATSVAYISSLPHILIFSPTVYGQCTHHS